MKNVTEQFKEGVEAADKALDSIQSPHATKFWQITGTDAKGIEHSRVYAQEELSFFGKQEFVRLINTNLRKYLEGDLGLQLADFFTDVNTSKISMPDDMSAEKAESMLKENMGVVQGIMDVINTLPDLQADLMMLALGVPRGEREWAIGIITGPVSRGGLTDDQGFEVIKTFITQNAKAIQSYFQDKGKELLDHFNEVVLDRKPILEGEAQEKPQSEDQSDDSDRTHGGTQPSISAPAPAHL